MFKNVMSHRTPWLGDGSRGDGGRAGQGCPSEPCGATQPESFGWAPARGQAPWRAGRAGRGPAHPALHAREQGGAGPVVKRRLEERCAQIEQKEGRKPGRKESRELRDEITQELLPMAFARTSSILVWIDLEQGRLVLDCASQGKADALVTALVQCLAGLQVALLDTQVSPQAAMTQWLTGGADGWLGHFAPGREVELKSGDEMNSSRQVHSSPSG